MKKLNLIIAIVFSGMLVVAQDKQTTDLYIAKALMFKSIPESYQVADSLGITINYDDKGKVFITRNNIIKEVKIEMKSGYILSDGKALIKHEDKIIIRFVFKYIKSNRDHYEDYLAYSNPDDYGWVECEKKMGSKFGHLDLKYKESFPMGRYDPNFILNE